MQIFSKIGSDEYAGLKDERFRKMLGWQKFQWLRRYIWRRDGKRCGLCGKVIRVLRDLHLDHIIQHHHGGPSVESNLRATHAHCNGRRPRGPRRTFPYSEHPDYVNAEEIRQHNIREAVRRSKESRRRNRK